MESLYRNQVLIVEDDENIRRFIAINLQRNEFRISEAASGSEALQRFLERSPDVVVLDIMLPDIDGFELCERMREVDPKVVIVFLTARGRDLDKIRGLELGADDYVVKPFNPLELVARINTVLRRTRFTGVAQGRSLQSGFVRIDLDSKKAYHKDRSLELTPKEYQLLNAFLTHPGKAMSRDELMNLVWGEDFVGDTKTVDVHVRKLREKLEEDSSKPLLIETVWGMGYRWRKDG